MELSILINLYPSFDWGLYEGNFEVSRFSLSRATNKSNVLLKEKLDGCQNKLKRAEEKLKNLSQVEVECEVSGK
jgi:hypothetical protein